MRYEQFANGHARYVTVRGAGPSKRLGLRPGQWDDRELLYQQVMHLGKSFQGGLYSDADMEAAAALRTMEIPEGSTAAAEFARLVGENAAAAGIRFPELSPEQRAEGTGVFSVFPNLVMLVSLANCFMYRVRPNGDDPDSCIFDMWALRLFPPDAGPPALVRESRRTTIGRRGAPSPARTSPTWRRSRPGCTPGAAAACASTTARRATSSTCSRSSTATSASESAGPPASPSVTETALLERNSSHMARARRASGRAPRGLGTGAAGPRGRGPAGWGYGRPPSTRRMAPVVNEDAPLAK